MRISSELNDRCSGLEVEAFTRQQPRWLILHNTPEGYIVLAETSDPTTADDVVGGGSASMELMTREQALADPRYMHAASAWLRGDDAAFWREEHRDLKRHLLQQQLEDAASTRSAN